LTSPLATRDRAHSYNDKIQNSNRKPSVIEKFEKVDDYEGDTEGLDEQANNLGEEPDEFLDSCSPNG
jgi:hypothetical protein